MLCLWKCITVPVQCSAGFWSKWLVKNHIWALLVWGTEDSMFIYQYLLLLYMITFIGRIIPSILILLVIPLQFFFQFVKTMLSQAHLCPLPLHVRPIYWSFDAALRIYPVPDLVRIDMLKLPLYFCDMRIFSVSYIDLRKLALHWGSESCSKSFKMGE